MRGIRLSLVPVLLAVLVWTAPEVSARPAAQTAPEVIRPPVVQPAPSSVRPPFRPPPSASALPPHRPVTAPGVHDGVGVNLGHFDARDPVAFDRDVTARLDSVAGFFGPGVAPYVRIELKWHEIQRDRDAPIRWELVDPQVDRAVARGMRVLLILAYAPHWATGHGDRVTWFPTEDAPWRSIVDATVARYGNRVHAYEVWNEPNMVDTFGNFEGKPPVQRYWELVRIAAERIRAGCATCVVLAGGSARGEPRDGRANTPSEWLRYAYDNGYGDDFDALAHHPYTFTWDGPAAPDCGGLPFTMFGPVDPGTRCGELTRVHAIMAEHGDADRKVWATEIGYPAASGSAYVTQARDNLLHALRLWRMLSYAGPFMIYTFQDDCADQADSGCVFGVVDRAYQPKQPLYRDLAAGLRSRTALPAGRELTGADRLWTEPGGYHLTLASNGDLTLVRAANGEVVWRAGVTGGSRLVNRADGNLVLLAADGRTLWSTGTPAGGPSHLVLQDDGSLVLRRNGSLAVTWTSGSGTLRSGQRLTPGDSMLSSPDGRYRLTLQTDGNLVLRRDDGSAVWSTGTSGVPGNAEVPPDRVFVMRLLNQDDGNLVLYRRNGRAAWSTGSWTAGPSTLRVENDGRLVLRRAADGQVVWASR